LYGLNRIGGCTKIVRGDVGDSCGLTSRVGSISCSTFQVSGSAHCMTSRRARLSHRDLAAHPGAGHLNCLTRARVLRLSRLEEVKDMLSAHCRPQGEAMVIRIGKRSTTADRYETRIANFWENHGQYPLSVNR
jgi:hypothetical protein